MGRWAGTAVSLAVAVCGGEPTSPPSPAVVRLEAVSPLEQRGPVGEPVNDPPAVRAVGATGQPVAAVEVVFSSSAGSFAPASAVTDQAGVARVGEWLVADGLGELKASAPGVEDVTFAAEGLPRSFDLAVRWLATPPAEVAAAVNQAEAILELIVWEDLPDEEVAETPVCARGGGEAPVILDEVVDDVLIFAVVEPMDGPGGAGAQGFPCLIRDPGTQTIVGFVRFDEDDVGILDAELRLGFALHEMIHALGFVPGILNIQTPTGFARSCLALPSAGAPNTLVQDTHFSCPRGRAAFDRIGGATYTGAKVPLENGATVALGANTLNHHWRKTAFRDELMTGWFTLGVPAPLSLVTVGALEDLGYSVSYSGAQPFQISGTIAPAPFRASASGFQLVEPESPAPVVHVRR